MNTITYMSDAFLAWEIVNAWCCNYSTDALETEAERRGVDWNDIKVVLAEFTESAIERMNENELDVSMDKAARAIEALFFKSFLLEYS